MGRRWRHLMLPPRYGRKNRILQYSTQETARLEQSIKDIRKEIQTMKANPLTHPEIFSHPPKMYAAELRSSTGVVAGRAANVARMIAKLARTKTFCNLARTRATEHPRIP